MSASRVAVLLTCAAVAVLGAVFAFAGWEASNRVATAVSTLVAVGGLGFAMWSGLAGGRRSVRAARTGTAVATGRDSRANTGVVGVESAVVDSTGAAHAADGGAANTGVEQGPGSVGVDRPE